MSQGVEAWSNLGLYGGRINDIAIDPTNPDKMFVGSYEGDGLFVTEDGGSTWQAVETENEPEGEGTFKDHSVHAVKIAPSNPNVIWVAHNYWVEKSTDGGQTWTHIRNSAMQRDCTGCGGGDDDFRLCESLAIHPTNPDIVYVGTGAPGGSYLSGAIYKTEDAGETWTKVNQGDDFDYRIIDLAIDANNPDLIWTITDSFAENWVYSGSLYRSGDGGETWDNKISIDTGWYDLEIKPDESNIIFVSTWYGLLRLVFDSSGNFQSYTAPLGWQAMLNVLALAFDPQDANKLYVAWQMGMVSRSTDGGESFAEHFDTGYGFKTLVVHPANGEAVFGGDDNLGVFRSDDHGQAWTAINNAINAVIVYDVAVDPNDSAHILAGTISGVYERKEAGGDWSRLLGDWTKSLQFDPSDSLTFYAGLWGWLAKTTDGGLNWDYTDLNVYALVGDIALHPGATDTIFVAVGHWILKSADGGASFEQVLFGENQSGESYLFNVVTIDPYDPQHIFAGGGNFYAPQVLGDLWESADGGANWDRTGLQDVIVNALLIDPQNPDIMYAGCGYSGGTRVPVYKSTDGGDTWQPSFEGIPKIQAGLSGVWTSSNADVFAVGSNGSVFRYDGSSWTEIDTVATAWLRDVWGSSATDVFAVGDNGTILHYDGNAENSWTEMDSGMTEHLEGVWGSSATDVFAVGDNGSILHYDGNDTMTWEPMSSGTTEWLEGIWGSSATDVFAVGDNGTILHYDGNGTMTWEPMNSGTTEHLEGVWGSSTADVFAVGDNGTILHYDGNAENSWTEMISGTTEHLEGGVWGSSATDVFAVGNDGMILHYDGNSWTPMSSDSTEDLTGISGRSGTDVFAVAHSGAVFHFDGNSWSTSRPPGSLDNAVTDLEFHRQNTNIVYASTLRAGVYVSPNQAGNWLNLGTPEHNVFAISTGSLYAATEGGLLQCTGTGVIAGQVANAISHIGIHMADVSNDFGVRTISISGLYMMVSPSGICDVTAKADRYFDATAPGVTVYGGDVSWANIPMPPDSVVVETTPYHHAGVNDNTFIAKDTSFAVHIEDPEGMDITDPSSIRLTINDGTTEYTRDLSHPSVTYKKMVSTEDNTQVTKIRVAYDRSRDDEVGDYGFGSTVNVRVDVTGMTQETCTFRVASEDEHNNVQDQIPAVTSVTTDLGVFDEQAGQDTGIQVTSGPLKGAMLIYSSDELVEPSFGPIDALPTLSGGVGVPMNLEPTNWSFHVPVKVYIPCPGYVDVSDLCVYFHNGTSWVYACDAAGNVQRAAERWMVRDSRKNNNNGDPSTIEIEVYHFSGVQASASAPPAPFTEPSAGPGGGGGGCLISTAACGCHVVDVINRAHWFLGLFILIGCLWLSRSSHWSVRKTWFLTSIDCERRLF